MLGVTFALLEPEIGCLTFLASSVSSPVDSGAQCADRVGPPFRFASSAVLRHLNYIYRMLQYADQPETKFDLYAAVTGVSLFRGAIALWLNRLPP